MDVLKIIRAGLTLAEQGGEFLQQGEIVLDKVRDAIADGRAAGDTQTLEEALRLLDREEGESRAASQSLRSAIDEQLAKG